MEGPTTMEGPKANLRRKPERRAGRKQALDCRPGTAGKAHAFTPTDAARRCQPKYAALPSPSGEGKPHQVPRG